MSVGDTHHLFRIIFEYPFEIARIIPSMKNKFNSVSPTFVHAMQALYYTSTKSNENRIRVQT